MFHVMFLFTSALSVMQGFDKCAQRTNRHVSVRRASRHSVEESECTRCGFLHHGTSCTGNKARGLDDFTNCSTCVKTTLTCACTAVVSGQAAEHSHARLSLLHASHEP
jgi:hypothetical protein